MEQYLAPVQAAFGSIKEDSETMVGYGVISKEQIPSGTVSVVAGIGMSSAGLKLIGSPTSYAIGLPTLGAGLILLYKGLLKEGVIA